MENEKRPVLRNEIEEGLKRIAFGSCADAIKLLLHSESLSPCRLKRLDTFSVASLKRTGQGISEIKFYDRLKALQLLAGMSAEQGDSGSGFLEALTRSAACTADDGDDCDEYGG